MSNAFKRESQAICYSPNPSMQSDSKLCSPEKDVAKPKRVVLCFELALYQTNFLLLELCFDFIFTSTGYDVLRSDYLLLDAKYFWTFDDVNDIKKQQGESWAQVSGSLKSTAGVWGRALKASGGVGPITLVEDTSLYLANPLRHSEVSLSLWVYYESKGSGVVQTLLAAGKQENGDRGIHLYQRDGSKEELTFNIKTGGDSCSFKFGVPQNVWTQLVFMWSISGGIGGTKVYRNGKAITILGKHCSSGSFNDDQDQLIKLGSGQLPLASFDDIIIWEKMLYDWEVERLFRFYKGKLAS